MFIVHNQIAFRQGAAILDAIRQGQPFCMAQQKMYSPQKWARSIVMLGAKLRSTCCSQQYIVHSLLTKRDKLRTPENITAPQQNVSVVKSFC